MRDSATAVQHELLECYALIQKLGRGVVYYGSARLKQDSPHWGRAVELGQQVAQLLGCTTWSGGGPGMMEAATAGVLCCAGWAELDWTATTWCNAVLCCGGAGEFVLNWAMLCASAMVLCAESSPFSAMGMIIFGVRPDSCCVQYCSPVW